MGQTSVQEGSGWHGRSPAATGGRVGTLGRQCPHFHEGGTWMCGELYYFETLLYISQTKLSLLSRSLKIGFLLSSESEIFEAFIFMFCSG